MHAVQPPLDEVPEEDWYCDMCIADGKARTVQKQKAAQGRRWGRRPPAKRSITRKRALAAMLSDDGDSDADAVVTVKVMNHNDRWAQLNDQCLAFVFFERLKRDPL